MSDGFGAFGKMPALGDFFRLNTPAGFVQVWDAWLQGAMMCGAETGGVAWDAQYMSAPIWRFSLSPGVAGAAKICGVLMPSVDRVGRRFPLSLMAAVPDDTPASLDHLTQDATFAQLEEVALAALDDGMDKDKLTASLADIPRPKTTPASGVHRAGTALVIPHAPETGIAPELAAGLLAHDGMAAPSLWSTLLQGSRRAMVCDGLPDALQACALFDLDAPLWHDARPLT